MAKPAAVLSSYLILAVTAQATHEDKDDRVPSVWRSVAIGLIIFLVIIAITTAIKKCLPRFQSPKKADPVEEEPQISIISSNGLMKETRNGNFSSNVGIANEKSGLKPLTVDINVAQTGRRRSPSISIELATPSCECAPEDAQPTTGTENSPTEWIPSTPPPPPPGTLLWVPSTARRRSVSLRGDSDEEKEHKCVCGTCGGSISQTHTPNISPPSSMTLERKRSVTFNTSVEEIHVLSNEPKKPRSRSPSLLLSAPFYSR